MWPLPNIRDEYVQLLFKPQSLTCSWIRKKSSTTYELCAYKQFLSNEAQGISHMFNPTYIKQSVRSFIYQHELEHAFISIALAGNNVVESIVELPFASPTRDQFPFPKLHKLTWDFRYLYPHDDARFAFYVGGINQSALLQYQLLAIAARLNVVAITPSRMAMLNVYQALYAQAFRHSHLARELQARNNQIQDLFTNDMLRRMLTIKPSVDVDVNKEREALITSLGLFIGKDLL